MGFCAILHSLAHFFTFLLGWQPKYYSNPPALDHSKKSACVNKTIIVGGGVIGFSTAYYLALSRAENTGEQDCIYIVDSSAELFAGASGQATGVLGDYGFSPEAAPLGVLSYNLHKQLAAENNGRETYGFSGIDIHQVFFKGDEKTTISHQPSGTQTISDTSHLPLWLKSSSNWGSKIVANHTNAARLDTHKFCEFLLKKCESLGVRILRSSIIAAVHTHEDSLLLKEVSISSAGSSQLTNLRCTNLVISAGPWSDRVFKFLFPFAKVQIPLNVSGASGNHLLIRTPHWKPSDDDFGCDQVYLDKVIVGGATLDVSTLLGGTMYVGGYGADPEELPALATQVQPQPSALEAIKNLVTGFLNLGEGESVEVLKEGRAYRPEVTVGRPIIAKLPLRLLFGENVAKVGDESDHSASAHIDVHGGVFVNTGHNSDGVTLGPGSGKVMAELIRGVETSVDISGLGLPT